MEVPPLRLCLVLESRLRALIQREKRDAKKGKSRKLTKVDLAEIEEELRLFAFQPDKFAAQQMQQPAALSTPQPPPSVLVPVPGEEISLTASAIVQPSEA